MKAKDEWLVEIERVIAYRKQHGFHSYFIISAEMDKQTVAAVKNVFSNKAGYDTEIKPCGCKKKTYDIIITW